MDHPIGGSFAVWMYSFHESFDDQLYFFDLFNSCLSDTSNPLFFLIHFGERIRFSDTLLFHFGSFLGRNEEGWHILVLVG